MGDPLFVVVHAPDRTNRSVQWVFLDHGGLDADEPLCGRSDHGEGLRCTVIMPGGHRALVLLLLAGSRWGRLGVLWCCGDALATPLIKHKKPSAYDDYDGQ